MIIFVRVRTHRVLYWIVNQIACNKTACAEYNVCANYSDWRSTCNLTWVFGIGRGEENEWNANGTNRFKHFKVRFKTQLMAIEFIRISYIMLYRFKTFNERSKKDSFAFSTRKSQTVFDILPSIYYFIKCDQWRRHGDNINIKWHSNG